MPSEQVFQTELNNAAAAAAEDFARICIRQSPVTGIPDGGRRRTQVEMVKRIQKIGAQLYAMFLRNREVLLHSDIPVPRARPVNTVPFRIAPLPRLRRRECRGIEPL